jgi:hypothetical protein
MLRSGGMDRPLFLIEDPTRGPLWLRPSLPPLGSRFNLCTLASHPVNRRRLADRILYLPSKVRRASRYWARIS